MLKKGDAVVHPSHGAGVVQDTQIRQVNGGEQQYHCIELVSGRGTLFLPADQVKDAGLSPVPGDADLIISVLLDDPQELSANYQVRKPRLAKKVHSGEVTLVAEALRDLTWRERESTLSDGDSQLKAEAQDFLAGVLALQLDMDVDAAARHLNETVSRAIQSRLVEEEVV